MDIIADFFEKMRNLVLWEDANMTMLFFILLAVIFIFFCTIGLGAALAPYRH